MADISNLIEQRSAIEAQLGIELVSLSAFLENSANWPHATIRGHIRSKNGREFPSDVKIVVAAHDRDGRIVGTNLHFCENDEPFEIFVGLSSIDIAKVSIYPVAAGASDNTPTQPPIKTGISQSRKLIFEEEIRLLTQEFGYRIASVPANKDEGVDLVVEKNGRRVAVRVKFRTAGNVGNQEVLKLLEGMRIHQAPEALFITTTEFSGKAIEVCNHANVVYLDHDRLLKFCSDHRLCLPSWCWLADATSQATTCLDHEISVGRDANNDLVITSDPSLSRQHFKLSWERLTLWIEDCGSSNGTRVDGSRIAQKTRLTYGSKISAGQQQWIVSELAAVPAGCRAILM